MALFDVWALLTLLFVYLLGSMAWPQLWHDSRTKGMLSVWLLSVVIALATMVFGLQNIEDLGTLGGYIAYSLLLPLYASVAVLATLFIEHSVRPARSR
jgi:hypothetical protein